MIVSKMKTIQKFQLSRPMMGLYLWFYRLIGITFGGLSMTSDGKLHINKSLKYYGLGFAVVFGFGFITAFLYTLTTDRFRSLYKNSGKAVYYAVIFFYTSKLANNLIILLYLNRKGSALLKVFADFKMKTGTNQKIIFFGWLLHLVVPIFTLIHSFSVTDIGIAGVYYQFNYCVFWILSFYYFFVIPHIIWNFSVHFFEFLRDIRRQLKTEIAKFNRNNCSDDVLDNNIILGGRSAADSHRNSADKISELKKFYLKIKTAINDCDQSLSLVITTDIIQTIFGLMLSVWSYALVEEHKSIQRLGNQFCIDAITMTIKLVISCFLNGLVYDESDKIMATLDAIDAKDIDDELFKEVLLFKTISRETTIGFTIGGFAPLRKKTLIQVSL